VQGEKEDGPASGNPNPECTKLPENYCVSFDGKQTSYTAPVGVTVFDFSLLWDSDLLGHHWPTFIFFWAISANFSLFFYKATTPQRVGH
jgi:hypothetical protein